MKKGETDQPRLKLTASARYTDLDRIRYAAALFASLLGCAIGFTFHLYPLLIVSFICTWIVDHKGHDVYRSFRRRIRRR